MVRSHLESRVHLRAPQSKRDWDVLENTQRRATTTMMGLERSRELGLVAGRGGGISVLGDTRKVVVLDEQLLVTNWSRWLDHMTWGSHPTSTSPWLPKNKGPGDLGGPTPPHPTFGCPRTWDQMTLEVPPHLDQPMVVQEHGTR